MLFPQTYAEKLVLHTANCSTTVHMFHVLDFLFTI